MFYRLEEANMDSPNFLPNHYETWSKLGSLFWQSIVSLKKKKERKTWFSAKDNRFELIYGIYLFIFWYSEPTSYQSFRKRTLVVSFLKGK